MQHSAIKMPEQLTIRVSYFAVASDLSNTIVIRRRRRTYYAGSVGV